MTGAIKPFRIAISDDILADLKSRLVRTRRSLRWMEPNFLDITHWSELENGGHFAAFEQPELFVRDVRKFFPMVR